MKKVILVAILALSLVTPSSIAASSKPSPKPTGKVATTKKPTPKKTTSKKPTAKKKVVKKQPHKKIRITPSPCPTAPIEKFKTVGELRIKVPTLDELVCTLSESKYKALAKEVDECLTYTCGAVQAISENGCLWFEVNAFIYAAQGDSKVLTKIGSIRKTATKSAPNELKTILLVTKEPLGDQHIVDKITVYCHHDPALEKIPSTNYTKIVGNN